MSNKHKHDENAFLISQESAKLGHQLPEDEIVKVLEIIEDTYTKTDSKLLEDHFDELTIKYAKNYQLISLEPILNQPHQLVDIILTLKTNEDFESESELTRLQSEMTLEEFENWSNEKYGYIYAGSEPLTNLITFKSFDEAKNYLYNELPLDSTISKDQLTNSIITSVQHGSIEPIAIRLGIKSIFNHSGYVILLPKPKL